MALIKDKIKSAQHRELLKKPEVKAILNTIRYAEGTAGENGYNTRVGGEKFDDLSKKPGKKVYIKSINDYSSAEGAYQFLNGTWSAVAKDLGLNNFSPESQDIAAIELIRRRGALNDVLNGNFEVAINKLSPEWASLPKSDGKGTYKNQRTKSINQLSNIFYKNLENPQIENLTIPKYDFNYYGNGQPPTDVIQLEQVSNLPIQEENINLAEQNDDYEVEVAKQQLLQKQQQKINEQNFLKDLLVASQVKYVEPDQQEEIFQKGGTVERDNKWLEDWYKNRIIPNERSQNLYLEDKPFYEERLKNIPPVTNVEIIDNNIYNTGQYRSDTNEILITPLAQPSVYTHEANHYLNSFPSAMRTVHQDIVNKNMYKRGDKRLGVNEKYYNYLKNPDEIHSRIQVLRKDAGFKPNEEVKAEDLKKYLQNYQGNDSNILEIMNLTDDKGLLNMLNLMADNSKKGTIQYVQNGGYRKKSEREEGLTVRESTSVYKPIERSFKQLNVRNKTDKEIAAEREAKIQQSIAVRDIPYTRENWREKLALETQSTGDKLRTSLEPNFFDDYINPAAMIGNMASNLGQAPYKAEQSDSNTPYITALAAPLVTGSLAGIGAQNTSQFLNNIANPLAGINFKKLPKVNFDRYSNQMEAVQNRAERMLSQEDKWVGQTNDLRNKFETAVERHLPESNIEGAKLGVNSGRESTEVSKFAAINNVPLNEANKARIAAHEVGHYYQNTFDEGLDWNSAFNLDKLPQKTRDYLMGKGMKNRGTIMGDELRERAAQLKDYIAQKNNIPLNENFVITKPQLNDALKNYVKDTKLDNKMTEFISSVKSKDNLLGLMNKYALSAAPIVGGTVIASQKEFQQGGIIKDNRGQWAHPGQITEISSPNITMRNVPFPVLGVSKETGEQKMMFPEQDYFFENTKSVIEYPQIKRKNKRFL